MSYIANNIIGKPFCKSAIRYSPKHSYRFNKKPDLSASKIFSLRTFIKNKQKPSKFLIIGVNSYAQNECASALLFSDAAF